MNRTLKIALILASSFAAALPAMAQFGDDTPAAIGPDVPSGSRITRRAPRPAPKPAPAQSPAPSSTDTAASGAAGGTDSAQKPPASP